MTNFLKWNNKHDFENEIKNLKPLSGVCIFIDIVGSTELKNNNLQHWIVLLGNSLAIAVGNNTILSKNVIKHIGDEIMIFIPDDSLENENHYTIFETLKGYLSSFNNELDEYILKFKAAIHYCTNVYNISFKENTDDYYGIDIDLTARLMKESKPNYIVISEDMFLKIKPENDFILFEKKICTGCEKDFKGILRPIKYRLFDIRE